MKECISYEHELLCIHIFSMTDTYEYVVPIGSYDNLGALLDDVDREDTRVLSFASKRSKLRLRYLK